MVSGDESGEGWWRVGRRGEGRQKTKQQLISLTSERDGFKQREHHARDGGGRGWDARRSRGELRGAAKLGETQQG